jgi:hypothetical protein
MANSPIILEAMFPDSTEIVARRWTAFDYQLRRNDYWWPRLQFHQWYMDDPFPPHSHGSFNVSIILEGGFEENYGSMLHAHGKKTRTLRAGDVMIRSPFASHHLRTTNALTLYIDHREFFNFHYWCGDRWVQEHKMKTRGLCENDPH